MLPPVGVLPSLRPTKVTVTAVLAASAVPPAVMTIDAAPGARGARVAPLLETVAVGVAVVAKKPEGKFRVTAVGSNPPAVGVKANVAATPDLPMTRWEEAMTNDVNVTAPPITPE